MIHFYLWKVQSFLRNLWDTLLGRPVVLAVTAKAGIKGSWVVHEPVGLKLAFRRTVYTDLEALLLLNPHLKGKLPL